MTEHDAVYETDYLSQIVGATEALSSLLAHIQRCVIMVDFQNNIACGYTALSFRGSLGGPVGVGTGYRIAMMFETQ